MKRERVLAMFVSGVALWFAVSGVALAGPVPRTLEREMLEMGERIPGFGGMFYDAQGYPNVYLREPGDAAQVKSLGDNLRVLKGDYEFRQLVRWRDELKGIMNLPGVVLLDADESLNRVRIGMDKQSRRKALQRNRLERELIFKNIPREAVVVEEVEPFVKAQTVQDTFRPVPGGVQIAFSTPAGLNGCTLGYNAFGRFGFGFITNSHCSFTQGGVQGTIYYQNLPNLRIGVEVDDPAYGPLPGCPAGRVCRYSDSLFALYDDPALGDFPHVVNTNLGSLDTIAPIRTVRAEVSFPSVGQVVYKVGRTTGSSGGTVTASCVTVNVGGTNISLLCQDVVNASAWLGDSGSPVFFIVNSATGDIYSVGLLWGVNGSGTQFIMSALENIEFELGPLTLF